MALPQRIPDPDAGIPDLVRGLAADSRSLFANEVRLAKIELHEGIGRAKSGAQSLAVAFGLLVVAAVACTIFIAALIGRAVSGHMWLGAFVAGVLDLVVGVLLIRRGIGDLREPGEALEETKATLRG